LSTSERFPDFRSRPIDDRVLGVLGIIQVSYWDRDLTLAKIAAMTSLSTSRLRHLLQHNTGASFSWHLHKRRTEAAAALLNETSLTVKEISTKAGCGSALTLARHFKKFFGCTPEAYRKRRKIRAVGFIS
jgi:AraC-like DNA-binding protein